MCGLVGMAGNILKDDRNMFRQMLIVDAVRGHHSTGVAGINDKRESFVFKKALSPVDLMQLDGFDVACDWDSQVLIGHNRYATVGKVNNATAHPFDYEGLIAAHNGTLQGWYNLPDSKDFNVDSECMIANLARSGFEKIVPQLRGAWAITAYDDNEHAVKIIRNEERPLVIRFKHDGSVMYWASEEWMITVTAGRQGIKLHEHSFVVNPDVLYTFPLPETKGFGLPAKATHTPLKGAPPLKQITPHTVIRGTTDSGVVRRPTGTNNSPVASYRMGDKVTFMPMAVEKSNGKAGNLYLVGVDTSSPWANVRVFGKSKKDMDYLIKSDQPCSGFVAAVCNAHTQNDAYLVVRPDTVKQVGNVIELPDKTDKDKPVELFEGPDGSTVTRKELKHLLKHGCGYCSADLEPGDSVSWVGMSPICWDCTDIVC